MTPQRIVRRSWRPSLGRVFLRRASHEKYAGPERGGVRYALPEDVRHALETVLEESHLDRVSIVYRPWYVQSHLAFIGARFGSVTRPGRIFTNIPEALFFGLDAHVLHEFFHVVQQWGREGMTTLGYLLHARRREREARDFVGANLERYVRLRLAARRQGEGTAIRT